MQSTFFDLTVNTDLTHHVTVSTGRMLHPLEISYKSIASDLGEIVVGATTEGLLCALFVEQNADPAQEILNRFPGAKLIESTTRDILDAERFFLTRDNVSLRLHLIGSHFQVSVWQELLKIPIGTTIGYGEISKRLSLSAGSGRAVGNAVGANPLAVIVPCHRVLRTDKKIGNYRWGSDRKRELLFRETQTEFNVVQ